MLENTQYKKKKTIWNWTNRTNKKEIEEKIKVCK